MWVTFLPLLPFLVTSALGAKDGKDAFLVDASGVAYCNLPAGARAHIPPLASSSKTSSLTLLQVQVVARHGSRTPYMLYDPTCWASYGFKWDCNLTELVDPDGLRNGTLMPWLYRKVYDGSPTVLGGTCHLGQLVQEGFYQEAANGYMLNRAYIGSGSLKLFDTDRIDEIPSLDQIYLRADDDPSHRTEMSGEFLVGGMFKGSQKHQLLTLPFHTGDYVLDDIYPNGKRCPLLYQLETAAYASDEWQDYNNSKSVRELDRKMSTALPGFNWRHMLDCLMTTACTGRPFPGSLDQETFDQAAEHATMFEAFPFHWNDSYYSKLAMGPFAQGLLDNIDDRVSGESELRFAMFLGHDTTLLPLLAAWGVWDGIWPSYASIITIELYQDDDDYYVRLVYAGKELVLPHCGSALCPLAKFKKATSWASSAYDPACHLPHMSGEPSSSNDGHPADSAGQVAQGVGVAAGAVAIAMVGLELRLMVLAMSVGMLLGTIATMSWSRRFAAADTTELAAFRALPLQDLEQI